MVRLSGTGPAQAELFCDGESMGMVSLEEGDILRPQDSASVVILPGEQRTVKVLVKQGTLRLKAVKFVYADEE